MATNVKCVPVALSAILPKLPAVVVHAGDPPASNTFACIATPPLGNVNLTSYGSNSTGSSGVTKSTCPELTNVTAEGVCIELSVPYNRTVDPS